MLVPSPNHGERKGGRMPNALLLHYTGLPTAEDALRQLTDPAAQVSAHYLVREDGGIVQLVPEHLRAWHAGRGSWAGETDVNDVSIGVEIANAGHRGGLPPYPEAQIETVIALCRDIAARWEIRPERVLAHSDVSHGRKIDPGEHFPWESLAKAGVGHYVAPSAIEHGPRLDLGDSGGEVLELQSMLACYGYGIGITGNYDCATHSAVSAFQRHFRQARVDGRADASTIATLRRLIEALAEERQGLVCQPG
jgi:N-acetylmuramoyl-L-alanine amidase